MCPLSLIKLKSKINKDAKIYKMLDKDPGGVRERLLNNITMRENLSSHDRPSFLRLSVCVPLWRLADTLSLGQVFQNIRLSCSSDGGLANAAGSKITKFDIFL